MKIWETSSEFPFRTLRSLGVVILLHGIILIVLGIFDVIWTVIKYTDGYDNCPTNWPDNLANPCDHDELVWTWVAEGVWGGFLVLLVGVLGTLFSRLRVKNLRFQRDMFGVGSIVLAFPVCPAVIVCSVLEIYYDVDIFYYMDGNELNTEDVAKFVVPLLVAIFAFLAWVVAIAAAVVACCASVDVNETLLYGKPQPRPMIVAQQPQPPQQPIVVQAPQPQQPQQPIIIQAPQPVQQPPQPVFEVVPIPQPAPPPYFVMGPHPAAMGPPPPFGPPMGPPPFGPTMGPMGPMGPPFRRPPLPAIMPPEPYM